MRWLHTMVYRVHSRLQHNENNCTGEFKLPYTVKREGVCKKDVCKYFAKYTGKH